jgi:hypothetical protein
MPSHEILGGLVQVYKRGGKTWHCAASIDGIQHRASTNERELPQAKEWAEELRLFELCRTKVRFGPQAGMLTPTSDS